MCISICQSATQILYLCHAATYDDISPNVMVCLAFETEVDKRMPHLFLADLCRYLSADNL